MTQVTTVVLGLPTLAGAYQAFGPIPFKKVNIGYNTISVPVGTPDVTPQVQTALQGKPQMLMIAGDPGFCQSVLKAQKTLGFTGTIAVIQQCLDSSTASAVGSLQGVISPTFYNTNSPQFKVFLALLGKYAPGTSSGGAAPDGFSVVVSFADAMTMGNLASVDVKGVNSAMTAAKNVPLALGGGTTFSCGSKPVPLLPSVCSGGINIATLDASGATASSAIVDVSPLYQP
jgi:branched-chain amino acid transport system substrate-binding protein